MRIYHCLRWLSPRTPVLVVVTILPRALRVKRTGPILMEELTPVLDTEKLNGPNFFERRNPKGMAHILLM